MLRHVMPRCNCAQAHGFPDQGHARAHDDDRTDAMSAQTTKIEEPRVPVMILTDRWSLADWVEGWALDPDSMDFAVFVSAWALNPEDVVVTVAARLGYFQGIQRQKTNLVWAAAAIAKELTDESNEIVDAHMRKQEALSAIRESGENQSAKPPQRMVELDEEDIPF